MQELSVTLEGASSWGLTLSALGCIHRASAVLVAAGVVDEEAVLFSEGSLMQLGESRDVPAVLAAVTSNQRALAVYSADYPTTALALPRLQRP
ncbi:hypothetical protein Lesp01_68060 [Lentzea sp. NBRC 102530]|nr:hypothetical protein Lesp01_68060 [Lentzea sp. NBRC 102530]